MSGGKPNIAGYELLTVLSGSMEPGIMTGSVIAVKPVVKKENMQVGDVITYQSLDNAEVLITHRIIEVQNHSGNVSYLTKGDNNDAPDASPIPASHVVAHYQNIMIPYIGYILSFSKTTWGIILMMIVPGAILVISQMINVWLILTRTEEDEEVLSSLSSPSWIGEDEVTIYPPRSRRIKKLS